MRSALLGVLFADDEARLAALNRAATRLTHTDPKAECGALAIALAARASMRGDGFDVYCLGALVLALFGFARKVGPADQDKAAGNVATQEAGKAPDDGPGHAPDGGADLKRDRGQI